LRWAKYEPSDFEDSRELGSYIDDSEEFGSDDEYVERFNGDGPNDETNNEGNLANWRGTFGGDESDRDISEYEPYYLSSRRRLAERVAFFLDAYDRAVSSE